MRPAQPQQRPLPGSWSSSPSVAASPSKRTSQDHRRATSRGAPHGSASRRRCPTNLVTTAGGPGTSAHGVLRWVPAPWESRSGAVAGVRETRWTKRLEKAKGGALLEVAIVACVAAFCLHPTGAFAGISKEPDGWWARSLGSGGAIAIPSEGTVDATTTLRPAVFSAREVGQ